MKKFNINNYVYVKLNERGKQILSDERYTAHKWPSKEGMYRFQLWEFMNIFGKHLFLGLPSVVEENAIYFDEKDFE
jgi:hypothetical protein